MNPDDLSAVAQDYLKVIWTRTEWGDPPMTVGELAQRFGTSAANVTETLKRLDAQGLVVRVPYKPVELTEAGARFAVAMVRRHRLIETFLVDALGYGWDEVHDEAERLEHAVSDEFIARIDERLGHPAADPHGDPIPDAEHRWDHPADACRLSDVLHAPDAVDGADGADAVDGADREDAADREDGVSGGDGAEGAPADHEPAASANAPGGGRFEILVVSDARPETLRTAQLLGLLPGAVLDAVESGAGGGARVRLADGAELDVPRDVADDIHVRPLNRS